MTAAWAGVGGHSESPPPMREQLRELVLLLRDVADSGVSNEDSGFNYVEVQIDVPTWRRVQQYATRPSPRNKGLERPSAMWWES